MNTVEDLCQRLTDYNIDRGPVAVGTAAQISSVILRAMPGLTAVEALFAIEQPPGLAALLPGMSPWQVSVHMGVLRGTLLPTPIHSKRGAAAEAANIAAGLSALRTAAGTG
jgi:hypothetical protein